MSYMFWIWLAVCVVSIVVEAITPSLVSIWFIPGGVVSLILSCFDPIAWYWQVLVFVVLSLVGLLALRPLAQKLQRRGQNEADAQKFKGIEVRLTSDVTFDVPGTAVLNGVTWSVRSHDGKELKAGDVVTVVALEGNKLIVEKK
ncbi:MAG: NfeD family protein [Clostridia bacterium]|nr:NfeD family protein [Clostridia bacterium]